jgi:hypothetical protein
LKPIVKKFFEEWYAGLSQSIMPRLSICKVGLMTIGYLILPISSLSTSILVNFFFGSIQVWPVDRLAPVYPC